MRRDLLKIQALLRPLVADNPRRPVDWRWQRAATLLNQRHERARRFNDDVYVDKALRFLADRTGGADAETLSTAHPEVFDVDQIFQHSGTERWMLEGLITAGEPVEDISAFTGIPVDLVLAYEALFYDVRGRLTTDGFIYGKVLDTAITGGFDENNSDKWYKLLGFHGMRAKLGAALLKAWWDFNNLPDGVKAWFNSLIRDQLLKRTALCVSSRQIDRETSQFLLMAYSQQTRLDLEQSKQRGAAGSAGVSADSGKALLGALNLAVADARQQVEEHTELRARQKFLEDLVGAGVKIEKENTHGPNE